MGVQGLTNQSGLPQLKITAFYGRSFARLVLRKSPSGVSKNLPAESAENSPDYVRAKPAQTVRGDGSPLSLLRISPGLAELFDLVGIDTTSSWPDMHPHSLAHFRFISDSVSEHSKGAPPVVLSLINLDVNLRTLAQLSQ